MPHDHDNDVPGDLVGEEPENLPGGFGGDDPDADIDATVDELFTNDVIAPLGEIFTATDSGGITSGTDYTQAVGDGATVDPADLLED